MKVSIIIPSDRPESDALRSVASALGQRTHHEIEVIVVAPRPWSESVDSRLRVIVDPDRNPARRRNRAAREATGEILGFVDDDAFATEEWVERAVEILQAHPEAVAVGGPDPAPEDSSRTELLADTLLAARWIGSGIACHEGRPGTFAVSSAHDVALVNLFVRRDAFEKVGGFDERVGYIGEDTLLVDALRSIGEVVYSAGVVVRHRRRAFPLAYVRQRWHYRVKTGEMLVRGQGPYRRSGKIALFLVVCFGAILVATVNPRAGIALAIAYVLLTLVLGAERTRLPVTWWPLIPVAFAVHHATYFAGIVAGVVKGAFARRTGKSDNNERAQ